MSCNRTFVTIIVFLAFLLITPEWHSVERSSAKAQQSPATQSSCNKFHKLIDISPINIPDVLRQTPDPYSAQKLNEDFPDTYRILPLRFVDIRLVGFA